MPTITSLSPTSGPSSGNNSVVITGTGFTGPTTVRFGSTATTFTMNSSTQITAIAPPGTGTVQVTVSNAGGTSNGASYTYLTVPSLSSISPSQGPTGTTVTLTGSGLSGVTGVSFNGTPATSFTVVSNTQITAVVPPGTGIATVTVTAPGGTSNAVVFIYVVVPTITSLAPTAGPPSGGNSVVITGTNFTGPLTVRFGSTATTFTIDSPTQITAIAPPGTGTVQVTVTGSGGTSNGLPYTYALVPSLSSINPSQGPVGTTVTLTGSGLSGVTAVRFGSTPATSFTVVSNTQITAVVPPGTGTVSVTVTSPAGTSNGVAFTYVVVPTITSITPNAGPTSGGNSVTITGTGFGGPTTVRFGSTAATFTINSPTQITAIAPPGTGTVDVTVTTSGGTSNGLPYTYVPVPALTSVTPNSGPVSGGNTVTLTGTGLATTSGVSFGGTPATSFIVVSDTLVTAVAPAGTGSVQVTVTTAGGTSNGVTYTYLPVPSLTSVVPNLGPLTGGNTVTLTGTGFTGATGVSFGGTPATSFTVNSNTQITATVPAGSGTVLVTVTTPGGTSNGVAYTYVVIPDVFSVVPNQGPAAGGNIVVLTGTGFTNVTGVSFGGTPATSFTVNSDTQITATVPAGSGTVQVTVTSPGGTSAGVPYTYLPVPTLTAVVPNTGSVTGGNTVTLTGTGLSSTSAVNFGATPALSFTVVSDTQVTAVVPPGSGTVQVTAVTAGGTTNGVPYTYVVVPTLTAVVPSAGPEAGGNTVVLTGTGLSGATGVSFGGTPATSFTVNSGTQITAVVPAGTGAVQVTVTTPGGTSNSVVYTYLPVPSVTAIVPNSGSVTGGTAVSLTGTGFTGATAVDFGATPATSFIVVSDTLITAVAPAGTGTVQVTVTTPGGVSAGVPFTYVPVPTLATVVPNSGPVTGGNTVVLTGTGFTGATAVDFGGTPATSFTVNSDTQIIAVAPAGTTGIVLVTVTTAGGESNGVAYTYLPIPVLSTVVPSAGPEAGGNLVTLTGTGFTGATAVDFGATAATSFTVVSDSVVTATVPAGTGTVQVTVTTPAGPSNGLPYAYVPLPVVTTAVPNQGPASGGTTVVLTGTGLSGATGVSFGGTPATSFTVNSDTQITAVAPAGTGIAQITVTTAGGTSVGVPFTYVPAPLLTVLTPGGGPATGGTTVTLTGTGFTGATGVSFGGTPATSFTVNSDTQITAVSPAGTGTVLVTVSTAGGTSNGLPYLYVPAPTLQSVNPTSGSALGGNTVLLTGTGLSGATAVDFGATPATSFTVVSDTLITAVAPPGTGTAQITVTTAGGTSNGVSYTYVPVPTLASANPTEGPAAGGNSVVLTGTGLTGASAVLFGVTPAASFTVDSDTQITATAPPGVGTDQITVVTAGGTSNGVSYTYVPAPAVVSLLPSVGSEAGGTSVVITGTNLSGATGVSFGGTPATTFTVDSPTQITATAPAGTGIALVTVTTTGGTSVGVPFTYVPVPTLGSVVPAEGSVVGGTSVTLAGTGFTGATGVSFGGTPATSFAVVSDTLITAVAPAGTGTVQVTVTTAGGTSNGSPFTYVAVPTLTSASPTEGPAAGGNSVVLTGTGLTGASAVLFGVTPATFTVDSPTQITATAPAGVGTDQITVVTAGGTSNGVAYTYVAAPTVVSLLPNLGSEAGGTSVVITGTNLSGATGVSFGGTPATTFTVDSPTQITAIAPAGSGIALVTVTTTGGTSVGVPFTYVPVPAVGSIVPAEGSVLGGTSVTLTGTGFTGATGVSFGGTPATSFAVVSDTLITAVAPAGTGTVSVTVTTAGGTSAGVNFTYVAVPTLTSANPTEGPAAGGNSVVLTGTGLTGASAVLFGVTPATFTVDSPTQITATAPAGVGTDQITVVTAGGTSNGVAYTYVLAPSVVSLLPSFGSETGGTSVTITGTNLSGATGVSFGGTPATTFTVDSPTQITATAPAGTGIQLVTVTTTGGTSVGVPFTYVPVPTLGSVVPTEGSVAGGTSVTLTGTGFTGATGVSFGGTPATSFAVLSDTQATAVAPAGTGTVQVTVTTAGGTSNGSPFTYVAVPTLTSASPTEGPAAGGNTVTLTGTNLTGASAVLFGVTPATFTVDSPTQITATAPAGTGIDQITVVTAGGTSNGVSYTYVLAPSVVSLLPSFGSETGGTSVTITGTNLSGATGVSFGGTPATTFTVDSPTQITATAPAGTGIQLVTVTTTGGTSVGVPFTYIPVPTLAAVVPTQGSTAGGTAVTVTGTGFTGATGVSFGGTPATSFAVVSDTQITATAPAHAAGAVNLTVTTPGGTSNATTFTYVTGPTITSLSPTSGPALGGTPVTITGAGFTGATAVFFGGIAAIFTVVSDTEITATAPAQIPGTVNVTVFVGIQQSNPVPYTYT